MNVLVVDDTKNIRALLTKCLELEGYTVKTAEDGRTALELVEKEHFDLAFLDIKMPMMSGTEVLRRMREMGVTTPVIIVTAYATVKNAVDCTQLGAVAYLQKPFTADKIKTVLKDLLACPPAAAVAAAPAPVPVPVREEPLTPALAGAKTLLDAGDCAGALVALRVMSVDNPFSPELYAMLAQASEGLGRNEDAERYRRLGQALE